MPIPPAKRVTFTANPLIEVVTQMTFPRLSELDGEGLPVEFQKLAQRDFPHFVATKAIEVTVDLETNEPKTHDRRRYEFLNDDRSVQAVLASDFIALTTNKYTRWEDFKGRATKLLTWFLKCYEPTEFSRIGLRYRDVISRSRLDLQDVPWTELLRPHLLGALAMSGLDPSELMGSRSSFALRLGENAKVQVNHGLVDSEGDFDYLIDSDFFIDQPTKATIDAAAGALEGFRPSTNNLFQWCITKRLFDAMGPQDVS